MVEPQCCSIGPQQSIRHCWSCHMIEVHWRYAVVVSTFQISQMFWSKSALHFHNQNQICRSSISFYTPLIWNNLQEICRNVEIPSSFKSMLITYSLKLPLINNNWYNNSYLSGLYIFITSLYFENVMKCFFFVCLFCYVFITHYTLWSALLTKCTIQINLTWLKRPKFLWSCYKIQLQESWWGAESKLT